MSKTWRVFAAIFDIFTLGAFAARTRVARSHRRTSRLPRLNRLNSYSQPFQTSGQ